LLTARVTLQCSIGPGGLNPPARSVPDWSNLWLPSVLWLGSGTSGALWRNRKDGDAFGHKHAFLGGWGGKSILFCVPLDIALLCRDIIWCKKNSCENYFVMDVNQETRVTTSVFSLVSSS
jgi:hypothetical protein